MPETRPPHRLSDPTAATPTPQAGGVANGEHMRASGPKKPLQPFPALPRAARALAFGFIVREEKEHSPEQLKEGARMYVQHIPAFSPHPHPHRPGAAAARPPILFSSRRSSPRTESERLGDFMKTLFWEQIKKKKNFSIFSSCPRVTPIVVIKITRADFPRGARGNGLDVA